MSYSEYPLDEQPKPDPMARIMMIVSGAVVVGAVVAGLMFGIRSLRSGNLEGQDFVAINGRTMDGTAISTDDYEGKILVVDFWATWCPPCREGIPALIAIQDEFADQGVQVIGVSGDTSAQVVSDYYHEVGMNFPTVFEGANEASAQYNVHAFPTTLVVDREGKIIFHGVGLHDIRAEVMSALE